MWHLLQRMEPEMTTSQTAQEGGERGVRSAGGVGPAAEGGVEAGGPEARPLALNSRRPVARAPQRIAVHAAGRRRVVPEKRLETKVSAM